ncbi:MAG: GHKL domain-containing protein [Lachnospiraceae bacterium]|nr:GHKL domain-containing protein [Lachnospiraceae bacterium]
MYSVVGIIYGIVTTIFTGYCLAYYFDSFMEQRKLFCGNGKYLVTISYVIIDYLADALFQTAFETKETIGKQLLLLGVVFGFVKLFYRAGMQMSVFLTITFVALKDLSSFISTTIAMCSDKLFDLWIVLLEKGYMSADTADHMISLTACILQLIMIVVYGVLFYKSLKMVVKNYKNKEHFASKEELLYLLTPGCVGFLLCILLRTILITVENGLPMDLYDKYPGLIPVVPSIVILALLSIVYSVKLFQNMIVANEERSDKLILEKQMKNMQEHMAEMEHIYSGVRSMKHDMKNTLSVIMQLALNEDGQSNEKLQNYLLEMNQTMDRLEFQYKTGNSVVDVLLNMKYHELASTMPDIQLNADRLLFPDNLQIRGYDIGIIIGNALDNAMEACKKLKEKEQNAEAFIILSSFTRGKMFFIEVENSFEGKITRKKYSEFPVTDKKDKKAHGIGLSNIKNTAEKYHGGVDWTVENKKFILTIMLQNERSMENVSW